MNGRVPHSISFLVGFIKVLVKGIPPDTAIHEQNGYAKVYNDNNLIETNVDNDKSDTTHTDMRNN